MKTSVHPNNIEQNNANKHITKKESISLFSGTAQTGACSQNQIYLYTGALTGFTQYTNKIVKIVPQHVKKQSLLNSLFSIVYNLKLAMHNFALK